MDSLVLLPDGHTYHARMAKLACCSSSQLPDPSEPLVSYLGGGSRIAWLALMPHQHGLDCMLELPMPSCISLRNCLIEQSHRNLQER